MRVRSTILAPVAIGAAVLTGISAASTSPYLRAAGARRGHIVAVFSIPASESGDTAPDHIAVAINPTEQRDGSFVSTNVRLKESISNPTRTASGMQVRTQHTLRPGRYYVKVSSVVIGLDCTPKLPCNELWSNTRRVIVPRP